VLVVDDNATNRRILDEVLRGWAMRPTLANGGETALAELHRAAAAGTPFPLVLLDCHMPGMDGLALARQIRQRPELVGATVLMLLSSDPLSVSAECRELGIATSLTKPIKQSDLLEAILRALGIPPAVAEETPPAPPRVDGAGRRLRVLLAEDNAVNQQLATHLLEARGHQVVAAGNGREALEQLRSALPFDVVLMDVQMPEMDGFEATAAIREREKGTGRRLPIIALTAHALKGDRERCLAAGMDGYLAKPLRSAELFQALQEVVPPAPEVGGGAVGEARREEVMDRAAALADVGGSDRLLRELAGLFLDECPRMLGEVRAALDQGDAVRLRRAAHSLRGAVTHFGAAAAEAAAGRLEALATADDPGVREEACQALEQEIHKLKPALAALVLPPAAP
jgi:CheY-like chemotaxis protein/HPt (histidine-containing phosphotransfer) domain-containing protein